MPSSRLCWCTHSRSCCQRKQPGCIMNTLRQHTSSKGSRCQSDRVLHSTSLPLAVVGPLSPLALHEPPPQLLPLCVLLAGSTCSQQRQTWLPALQQCPRPAPWAPSRPGPPSRSCWPLSATWWTPGATWSGAPRSWAPPRWVAPCSRCLHLSAYLSACSACRPTCLSTFALAMGPGPFLLALHSFRLQAWLCVDVQVAAANIIRLGWSHCCCLQVSLVPVAMPGWYRASGTAGVGPLAGGWRGGQVGSWWDFQAQELPAGLYRVEVRLGQLPGSGVALRVKYQDAGALV
jgi:hypothetical protein